MKELKYKITNIISEENKSQLLELYSNEWWTKDRTREDLDKILEKSSLIWGLINQKNKRLVGFARVLTDYFKYAYIYDLIVDQNYRNLGLGKIIVNEILKHPEIKRLKNIELTCVGNMANFYQKFEFSTDYGKDIYGNEILAMRRTDKEKIT